MNDKERKIKREAVELRGSIRRAEGEAGSRLIRGRAVVFNQPTTLYEEKGYAVREVIAPEAMTRSLLDGSDIRLTMFHDPHLILARSKKGEGTLRYSVSEEGVDFEAEMPATADGDKALELISRGEIDGCSFWAYPDWDDYERSRAVTKEGKKKIITYTLRNVRSVRDFTITDCPAYGQTAVETFAREAVKREREAGATADAQRMMRESWERVRAIADDNNIF